MFTHPFGSTGKRLSAIGFGGMRLPTPNHHEAGIALLHAARRAGVTYFDTAPFYGDDQSETIFGEALRSMPESDLPLYVSSKCSKPDGEEFRRGLERSLERLGLPRISFFHLWCVMSPEDWQSRVKGGALAAALRAKEEGLVEHVCVSTHMRGTEIAQLLADHPEVEGITVGYCAINFPFRRAGVETARRLGRGVIAMNPLGGGLIPRHADTFDFIRGPDDPDVVSAALRFLVSDRAVTTALVGFHSQADIDAALAAIQDFTPWTPAHLHEVHSRIESRFNELCTGCGYCLPCPRQVPIPQYMDTANLLQLKAGTDDVRNRLKDHWDLSASGAARCIECGICETRCTQHLPIIARLKQIAALDPAPNPAG